MALTSAKVLGLLLISHAHFKTSQAVGERTALIDWGWARCSSLDVGEESFLLEPHGPRVGKGLLPKENSRCRYQKQQVLGMGRSRTTDILLMGYGGAAIHISGFATNLLCDLEQAPSPL